MIACWRIQSLSLSPAVCGLCNGGFCFALAVGGSGSQSPLGQAKRGEVAGVVLQVLDYFIRI
jgi:hypothetical protein